MDENFDEVDDGPDTQPPLFPDWLRQQILAEVRREVEKLPEAKFGSGQIAGREVMRQDVLALLDRLQSL